MTTFTKDEYHQVIKVQGALIGIDLPSRIVTALKFHGLRMHKAILSDIDQWSADVLAGHYDDDLRITRNMGPQAIQQLKAALRKNAEAQPQPPQPSPASKAEATQQVRSGIIDRLLEDRVDPGYVLYKVRTGTGNASCADRGRWTLFVIAHDLMEALAIAQDRISVHAGTPDEATIDSIELLEDSVGGIYFDANRLKAQYKP